MFKITKHNFNHNIKKVAKANVLKNLKKEGIDYTAIPAYKLNGLIALEVDILKADTKKVGAGVAIGLGMSILSGGIL